MLFIIIVFLSITAIVYDINYPLIIEDEANGNMFDDITITRDLSDLLNVKPIYIKPFTVESKANLELEESHISDVFIESALGFNLYDFEINPSIQNKETLYKRFLDKLDSIRNQSISTA